MKSGLCVNIYVYIYTFRAKCVGDVNTYRNRRKLTAIKGIVIVEKADPSHIYTYILHNESVRTLQ